MNRPELLIAGALASLATSEVEEAQPSGAVEPRHVSRRYICADPELPTMLELLEPDSNKTNRPSLLTEGFELEPSSEDPSGPIETAKVFETQPPGASMPSQLSASKTAAGRGCVFATPVVPRTAKAT